jgi:hypothetical protein
MNNMMSNTMSNVKSANKYAQPTPWPRWQIANEKGHLQQHKTKKNSTASIPQAITQEKIKCNEEYKTKKNSKAKYQT